MSAEPVSSERQKAIDNLHRAMTGSPRAAKRRLRAYKPMSIPVCKAIDGKLVWVS